MDEDMYCVVYKHIKSDYEAIALRIYGFVPHNAKPMIVQKAFTDTLEMKKRGTIKGYYEYIKNQKG